MPSKQFEQLQETSRARLAAMIPHDCPLRVERVDLFGRGGFKAITLDNRDCQVGRFEVVAAYITGYVSAWQRGAQPLDAVSRTQLPTGRVRYPGIVDDGGAR